MSPRTTLPRRLSPRTKTSQFVAEPVSEPIVDPVVEPLVADNSGEEEVTDNEVADEEDMSGSETASAASFPGVLSGLATSVFAYALRGLLAKGCRSSFLRFVYASIFTICIHMTRERVCLVQVLCLILIP